MIYFSLQIAKGYILTFKIILMILTELTRLNYNPSDAA